MKTVLIKTILAALPFAFATMASAHQGDVSSCVDASPSYIQNIYNSDMRIATGDLHAAIVVLGNVASKYVGRGGEEIQCLADAAAMAAWNYKQVVGASNIKDYVVGESAELKRTLSALKHTFRQSSLYKERAAYDAFIAMQEAWHVLKKQLQ